MSTGKYHKHIESSGLHTAWMYLMMVAWRPKHVVPTQWQHSGNKYSDSANVGLGKGLKR